MFLRDGPPVVEHGVLEDDPVVAVEPRLVRGLAVDERPRRRGLDQVADDAQQRRLAAARRADQRDELARADVEVDVLERDDPAALELLRHALERDGGRRRSCDVLRRAANDELLGDRDDEEEEMPSSAAMMFVAQRLGGELGSTG